MEKDLKTLARFYSDVVGADIEALTTYFNYIFACHKYNKKVPFSKITKEEVESYITEGCYYDCEDQQKMLEMYAAISEYFDNEPIDEWDRLIKSTGFVLNHTCQVNKKDVKWYIRGVETLKSVSNKNNPLDVTLYDVARCIAFIANSNQKHKHQSITGVDFVYNVVLDKGFCEVGNGLIEGLSKNLENRKIKYFNTQQFNYFIKHVPKQYVPVMVAMYECGLRCKEATKLRVRDCDIKKGVIKVDGRTIPMSPVMKKMIKEQIDKIKEMVEFDELMHVNIVEDNEILTLPTVERYWLFPSPRFSYSVKYKSLVRPPISSVTIGKMFRESFAKAFPDIDNKVEVRILRNSYIVRKYAQGVGEEVLKEQLGVHSNLLRYKKVAEQLGV